MRATASSTRLEWPCAVSTTTRSTPASISRSVRAKPGVADRGGRGDAQPPLLVLAGMRVGDRLLDVLDGDQADAAILVVDHQQLLDPVLVQQALGLLLADAFAHRDQAVLGHQLGDLLAGIGGEAHVAIGEDADQLAGLCRCRPPSTTGMPEMPFAFISASASASVASGPMVTGFTTMPDSNFFTCRTCVGLLVGLEVAVDDADAAGLRHGDRHPGLGHRVHGRGDDRDVERDRAGDARADVGLGRQHLREARLEQDVVEGERLARGVRWNLSPSPTLPARGGRLKRRRTGGRL